MFLVSVVVVGGDAAVGVVGGGVGTLVGGGGVGVLGGADVGVVGVVGCVGVEVGKVVGVVGVVGCAGVGIVVGGGACARTSSYTRMRTTGWSGMRRSGSTSRTAKPNHIKARLPYQTTHDHTHTPSSTTTFTTRTLHNTAHHIPRPNTSPNKYTHPSRCVPTTHMPPRPAPYIHKV
jgi:hypothetical protein